MQHDRGLTPLQPLENPLAPGHQHAAPGVRCPSPGTGRPSARPCPPPCTPSTAPAPHPNPLSPHTQDRLSPDPQTALPRPHPPATRPPIRAQPPYPISPVWGTSAPHCKRPGSASPPSPPGTAPRCASLCLQNRSGAPPSGCWRWRSEVVCREALPRRSPTDSLSAAATHPTSPQAAY